MKNELKSTVSIWHSKTEDRTNGGTILPCGLFLYTHRIVNKKLAGKRLLFMSDFHSRHEFTSCHPGALRWKGVEWLGQAVHEAADKTKPDIFIFGGDLASESAMLREAFDMLDKSVPRNITRISIPGNWDRRRKRWLPDSYWKEQYSAISFRYLVNERFETDGIIFYGMDDFKLGKCIYRPEPHYDKDAFVCLLTHNPDGVTDALDEKALRGISLILCGHTHGGQFRIPFFGALKTSSRHWKKFELGLLKAPATGTEMLVSAGLGATWLPHRLNCPPEAYTIIFTGE